jgi:RNA polymerase sigma factor for flagellar operon FliA
MLPRVHAIVRRMRIPAQLRDHEDLVQEGMVAAVRAAQSYDPHRDTAYSTWAETKVHGAVVDYLRQQDRTRSRRGALLASVIPLDGAPGARSEHAGADGDSALLHEVIPDERAARELEAVLEAMHAHERDDLVEAIRRLPERQRSVVAGLFWDGLTGHQIAGRLGVSDARVSQLRVEALRRLREDERVQAFAESYFAAEATRAA